MNLEELKVIWDSQNEPLYAMDGPALHAIVRRRNQAFARCEARRYAWEIGLGLTFGALLLALAGILWFGGAPLLASFDWIRVPVSPWDVVALTAAGVGFFYYGGYMLVVQRRQRLCEADFAVTLRGDIDRALARTEFLTRIARGILWCGLIPQWIAALLWIVTVFRLLDAALMHYLGVGLVMVLALILCVRCERRRIERRFEPHRRELEALREKLDETRP